ncbi:MAG TPA: xanthine dehydrogenase family protein molybdopterin-binding subunit [Stellaceae bacterium]|nr:xanthine dehydrogenase family protein molybdopterin-binding subunit [Stellaceae bacterium]
MGEFGIGQPLSRFEDKRLLRGAGRFIDDVSLPRQARAYILRSPHAHARILRLDIVAAASAPGVLAAFTAADLAADGLGSNAPTLQRKRPDGTPMFWRAHQGLAQDRVRYVGDPVAMIVAETIDAAKDAAELVDIAYEPLPSVTANAAAGEADSAAVWDECPDNISHVFEVGDKGATAAAFARAANVVRGRYVVTRVHAQFMEPRGAIGVYEPRDERFTLYADVQYPHRVREVLAGRIFKVPAQQIRVVAGDIGGAFGIKGWQYAEHRLVLFAARRLGRPVKWLCERSEVVLADEHGRDCIANAELALDAEGKFIGLRVRVTSNIGAYLSSDRNMLATFTSLPAMVGVYAIPAAHVQMTAVMTNTNATAPYRGAGRPEAIYVIERLIDDAARAVGRDPVALRRANLIPAAALPLKTVLGFTYDCGEFEKNMGAALRLADHAGFAARRADAKRRGKLRGIGIANPIERAASPGMEFAEIRFDTTGMATLLMGTKNQGQGHETTFRQIAAEKLGLRPEEMRYVDGDTDVVAFGMGTMGSRSTVIGGTALTLAAEKVVAKARKIAAHLLEVSEPELAFAEGRFTVPGTDHGLTLREAACAAFQPAKLPKGMEPGLFESGSFSPPQDTFPNGCHVCEVEIDPETGALSIERYSVVDDVGTVVNPKTLKGQIHGGVAQGLGQVLMEEVVYDRQSGQLLTASFMDYAMPRAADMSAIDIESSIVPTRLNPLGVKGAGEAGTVGALPAVMNAILDALAPLGVTHLDMPATPARIWQAITAAKHPS